LAGSHVGWKVAVEDSIPLIVREPTRSADDFNFVVAQNGSSADKAIRSIVHRDQQQVYASDAFVEDAPWVTNIEVRHIGMHVGDEVVVGS
jgi:hypothetical protein